MPKMKTNRSAAKRFYKISANGKVKRMSGGKSHSNDKKGRKRVNRLATASYETGASALRIKRYIHF